MKKAILTLSVLIAAFIFPQCSQDTRVKAILEIQAKAVNLQCPLKLDNSVTMTKCEVIGNRTLRYYYSMNLGLDVDTVTFKENAAPAVIDALKEMPESKQFSDYAVVLQFRYHDQNGKYYCQIEVTPEQYKQDKQD
ncbi:MAG: hypothetical protein LBN74_00810 [Prevotella sp.]|jgi:hypothetical protein|nr:hypothetical protein [Prevotella sp.]